MSIPVTLMDGEGGATYTINVTSEEATRINSDMAFAAEMLFKCKQHFEKTELNEDSAEQTEDQENVVPAAAIIDTNVFKWPHEAILLLIEEYRKISDSLYSGKLSQKKTWQHIGEELLKNGYTVTGPQCQSKFGGLKRTYKSIKDHNSKSGNGTRTWPYFDLLDSLLGDKPYMSPIATASSTGKRREAEPSSSTLVSPIRENPKKKPNYSSPIDKVILAIEENRKVAEENRDKRHKEKMEQKKEAMKLLERLVSVMEKKKVIKL